MVRNNMLVKTVVTGSLQRRNAERPAVDVPQAAVPP